MSTEKTPTDLLGLAPYGEAIKVVAEKSAETAQQFLYEICKPAAAEFGLLLRDQVRVWRAKNLANIANKARELVTINAEGVQLRAHPRIVAEVIENGSWCEDAQLQTMWAGLLAASCTPDGKDEANLVFTDILHRLTSPEAKLVAYACEHAEKYISSDGDTAAKGFRLPYDEIYRITGLPNADIFMYHLGHIYTLGLFHGGRNMRFVLNHGKENEQKVPSLTPESLGLHFYVRCCGSRQTPAEFFGIAKPSSSK